MSACHRGFAGVSAHHRLSGSQADDALLRLIQLCVASHCCYKIPEKNKVVEIRLAHGFGCFSPWSFDSIVSRPGVREDVMAEGHGRRTLLTSWWPASSENQSLSWRAFSSFCSTSAQACRTWPPTFRAGLPPQLSVPQANHLWKHPHRYTHNCASLISWGSLSSHKVTKNLPSWPLWKKECGESHTGAWLLFEGDTHFFWSVSVIQVSHVTMSYFRGDRNLQPHLGSGNKRQLQYMVDSKWLLIALK